MDRRLAYALCLVAALLVGRALAPASGAPDVLGASPALAGEILQVSDGMTFVTSDGGNAYLWRREGDRLVLLNHSARTGEAPDGQATYVSLPGVERGS